MYATNYFEKAFLNTFRNIKFTAPADVYLALFLSNPTDTGVDGIEISYEGYERQKIQFSAPSSESGGIGIKNDLQIRFPETPNNVGTITHIAVFDSKTGGNMLLYGQLNEALPLGAAEAPVLLEGEVLYYVTGNLSDIYKTKLLNVLRQQNIEGFHAYLSLFTNDPESAGSELSGDNYARISLTFSAPIEGETGQAIIENSIDTNFARPTTDWGTLRNVVIMDSQISGNPVCKQSVDTKQIKKGFMPLIKAGAIKVMIN